MKNRKRFSFLCVILCALLLVGCTFGETETPASVEVTYVLGNGEQDVTEKVSTLLGIVKAPTPTRENYIFSGWYRNQACTQPYDLTVTPKKDMTLYARWVFDYETYINEAQERLLPSTVKVTAYTYSSNFFGTQITSSQSGSGVVIFEDRYYYYLLTNHHVTYLTSYGNKAYTVTDLYENEYDATLMYTSADYDLSLLRIQKSASYDPLRVAKLASEDADVSGICVAVGSPGGIRNALTLGKIKDIREVTLSDTDKASSDVKFAVLWHTAPMDHGSSGGALFDDNYRLIGVNYAASTENEEFVEGYTVPASKVVEFLKFTALKEYF